MTQAFIVGTRIARYPITACALVEAQGPRGGTEEWTVTLDRHGHVKDAVRHAPSYAYRSAARIAPEIAKAATQAFHSDTPNSAF
jgi:hypothetical protein